MSKSGRKPAAAKSEYAPFGVQTPAPVHIPTTGDTSVDQWLAAEDLFLFNEGSHIRLYEKLGSHPGTQDGLAVRFLGDCALQPDDVWDIRYLANR